MQSILEASLLALFIIISAFFAAAEVSFLAISSVKLHSFVEKELPGAQSLYRLKHNRRRVIVALLIGNNIANVGASAFATSVAMGLFGDAGLGIAVGAMSFLLLTFGDIAPKSAATTYGDKFILLVAPLIEIFCATIYPLVVFFEFINSLIPGVYSRATGIERFTEEEVRSAVRLGAKHNSISENEKTLIENVLNFNDRTVGDAMTGIGNVETINADCSVEDAYKKVIRSNYSRFPVLRNGKPIGVVGVKVLARAMQKTPKPSLADVMREPIIFPAGMKANEAFARLQKEGRNIALVIDAQGIFVGVITLEDLIEEIVGEIN